MAYLPLSTANLPDPVIDPAQGASPEDYFNTVLWTGTSASNSITGVGFQPDFTWIKNRTDSAFNILIDSVRGATKRLFSDATNAESTSTQSLTSFDSDGFTVGSDNTVNGSSDAIVAWNWKANGSGVTNTDGSITSTVSANTTSGFSIATYSGTGANATVGHGLNSAPEMVIVKSRTNGVQSWCTWHTGLSGGAYALFLEATNAESSQPTIWNSTVPTSTVFSVGTANGSNQSANNFIAYCFHSVEGFSKFGSYVGNGSADGPFVYTGFRPAFLLHKRTNSASNWIITDATRGTSNPVGPWLIPNASDAEYDADFFDYCANGFKLRTSGGGQNGSGDTHIYMAFAENPFKYSNAR